MSTAIVRDTSQAAEEISTLHAEIGSMVKATLDKAMRIGELLTEVKAGLNHGEWLPWAEANLPFTSRTASSYMRLFERRHELKSETVSDLSSAYRMLSEPKEEPIQIEEPPPSVWSNESLGMVEDPRLMPAPGCALIGIHNKPDGSGERLFIWPDTDERYCYVNYLWSPGIDRAALIDSTRRPVRRDCIALYVSDFCRTDLSEFEWDNSPAQPWTYNILLYKSDEDYVQQSILGRPPTWAADDRKKYEALKADIARNGVLVPVALDECGYIIDGFKRVQACEELGITVYPITAHLGLSDADKEGLRQSLNGAMYPGPCAPHKKVICKNPEEFDQAINAIIRIAESRQKIAEIQQRRLSESQ